MQVILRDSTVISEGILSAKRRSFISFRRTSGRTGKFVKFLFINAGDRNPHSGKEHSNELSGSIALTFAAKKNMKGKEGLGKRIVQLPARFGLDPFILLLIAMVVLAKLFPEVGAGEGPWSLSSLSGYGVSLIFFFYGLKLNFPALKAGLRNWKLHVVVQMSTFLLFPLLVLSCKSLFPADIYPLWLGVFFLASLPSTVSSSVVMVSIAEGNIPAAIFNASISAIIGIFITPVWMRIVNVGAAGSAPISEIILKLILQVLVPVILGLLLNKKWGHWAERHKKQLKHFDQAIILSIVYTAFCESFSKHMFDRIGVMELLLLGISMVGLFFLVYFIVTLACKAFSFNREDSITAKFCGSKKSLVHGTVMSKVLFPQSTMTGILLLPLMLYHALQLIIVSMIAQKLAKDKNHADAVKNPGGAVAV